MVLIKFVIGIGLAALTLFSCTNEKSLQRYLVDRQDDDSFLKIDIAESLLQTDNNNLSQEEKDVLKTVKKINVVAYPIKGENTADYKVISKRYLNKLFTVSWYPDYNKSLVYEFMKKLKELDCFGSRR